MSHSPRIRTRTDESGVFVVRKITIRKLRSRPSPPAPHAPQGDRHTAPGSPPLMIGLVIASAAWLVACALWAFN